MKKLLFCAATVAVLSLPSSAQVNNQNLRQKILSAKPGSTIQLPAGVFKIANLALPSRVSLKGAGYDKTILDAAGADDGILVRSNAGVSISDLTIQNARRSALALENSLDVTVARIRVLGSLTGIIASGLNNARIENVIGAGNRNGLALSGSRRSVVVNCTLANNTALGISAARNQNSAIFNNVVVGSPTGLYLGKGNNALALDYNLYVASFIGKKDGEVARKTVQSWRDVSNAETHSVSLPVEFSGPDNFRPTTPLTWSPNRATTSDWGVATLGVFKAPLRDIDGKARIGETDLGAYEVLLQAPRPADGRFRVQSDAGIKSAGLFREDGTNAAWLFQNLPLRRGEYSFWLPPRDVAGRAFPACDYRLRLVESDLKFEYLGLAFNNGKSNDPRDHSSYTATRLAFDEKDRFILGQGWSENHLNVRAFDAAFENPRWELPGSAVTRGITTDGAGNFYTLRVAGAKTLSLVKLNAEDGKILEIAPGKFSLSFANIFSEKADGLAALGGQLYVADPLQNKLFFTTASAPEFAQSVEIAAPSSPRADIKNNLIWLISGDKELIAVDAAGTIRQRVSPTPDVAAIDVKNGLLAALSPATGKIHIFDCTDPANLKPLRTIGRGDSPYGPLLPDRFLFKSAGDVSDKMRAEHTDVAINSKGEVAVLDNTRTLFFDANGNIKRRQIAVWGQHLTSGKFIGDAQPRFFSIGGDSAITLDSKTRTWQPAARYFIHPSLTGRAPIGFFNDGDQNFGVFRDQIRELEDGTLLYNEYPGNEYSGSKKVTGVPQRLVVLRFDGYVSKMLTSFRRDEKQKIVLEQRDANGDGLINENDPTQPVLGADGKPLTALMGDARFITLLPDGSLRMDFPADAKTAGYVVPRRGLDSKGIPVYDWANRRPLTMLAETDSTLISPYDFKTPEKLNGFVADLDFFADQGYAATVALRTSGGMGLANNFGTDVAGFDKDGKLRWLHPLSWTGGVGGIQIARDIMLTNRGTDFEFIALDRDGLGLGVFGPREEVNWKGMWIDHPEQFRTFIGNDNKINVLVGDYVINALHWFELGGEESIKRSEQPVTIDAAKAATLAALPVVFPAKAPAPPATRVLVRKLNAPLTIDGDLQKWRKAGITPQILATPETASPDITGPGDCSAVVRLAHEGGNLYVQVIKFDDVVTMHQPLIVHYKQDSTEMAINSFMSGYKFNVTRTQEHGETIFRDRFGKAAADLVLDPKLAPRSIRVLDSARDIEERKLIEGIYGTDLSNSKVIVTEWKLPLDYAFATDPASGPKGNSGESFWLGFTIDDNDVPGSDIQKLIFWPATYGTFEVKERGALATLE